MYKRHKIIDSKIVMVPSFKMQNEANMRTENTIRSRRKVFWLTLKGW